MELHKSQERVDCLDFLVWRMEKEKQSLIITKKKERHYKMEYTVKLELTKEWIDNAAAQRIAAIFIIHESLGVHGFLLCISCVCGILIVKISLGIDAEPKGAEKKLAAIAVCGPFGAVKEQAAGLYAQTMAERGFLTIAFGASAESSLSKYPLALTRDISYMVEATVALIRVSNAATFRSRPRDRLHVLYEPAYPSVQQ